MDHLLPKHKKQKKIDNNVDIDPHAKNKDDPKVALEPSTAYPTESATVEQGSRRAIRTLLELYLLQPYLGHKDWISLRHCCFAFSRATYERCFEFLLPHQIVHFRKMRQLLATRGCALDMSATGRGKTYVSCALSLALRMPMTILTPTSAIANWEKAFKHFGIENVKIQNNATDKQSSLHTYSRFASHAPPYLIRNRKPKKPDVTVSKKRMPNWTIHPDWPGRVESGTLFILDESHFLKNASLRSDGVLQLISLLSMEGSSNSKILLLSATSMNQPKDSVRLLRLMSILPNTQLILWDFIRSRLRWTGMNQLFEFCESFPEGENYGNHYRDLLACRHNVSCEKVTWDVLRGFLKHHIIRAMPSVDRDSDMLDVATLIFDQSSTKRAIHLLKTGCKTVNYALWMMLNNPQQAGSALGVLNRGMRMIERGKVDVFVSLVGLIMTRFPQSKVIVALNYLNSISCIANRLTPLKPLVLTGAVRPVQRRQLIDSFQQPNLNHRVIIANSSVIATGLDLDDKDGAFPRFMFISPSYYLERLHQVAGRIQRCDTKSKATVRYVYHDKIHQERAILMRLAEKAQVMDAITPYATQFPGTHRVINLREEQFFC